MLQRRIGLAPCQRILGPGCHGAGTEKCRSDPCTRVLRSAWAKASGQLAAEGGPCLPGVCSPLSKAASKMHRVEIVHCMRSQWVSIREWSHKVLGEIKV